MEEGVHQTSRHAGLDACSVECVRGMVTDPYREHLSYKRICICIVVIYIVYSQYYIIIYNMYACLQTQPNKESMHVVLFKQLTHALNAAVHWTALARSIVCLKIIARLTHRRGRTGNVLCS